MSYYPVPPDCIRLVNSYACVNFTSTCDKVAAHNAAKWIVRYGFRRGFPVWPTVHPLYNFRGGTLAFNVGSQSTNMEILVNAVNEEAAQARLRRVCSKIFRTSLLQKAIDADAYGIVYFIGD